MNQDEEHLRLLSIFHFVVGGLLGIFSLFPLIHVGIGLFLVFGGEQLDPHGNGPPPAIGWLFVFLGSMFILIGLSIASLVILTGRFLATRRHHLFCLVVACVECLFMPFGTVLGVFTIIVLSKESVKQRFAGPVA